ncbi:hypothetical protein E0Z10_g7210 [Xylaria hypoxylon]|uniref:LysM domain-containing protein n=1 Tax=Xylaria hypoxylon TaxID=37992 RepID=A0A4Z0YEI9_9PEZI|nr:hypothetical protein E0Z10_g7210 [Xylaria hypoxylon]
MTSVTALGPTQSGIVANCTKFAKSQMDDICDTFAARNSISNASCARGTRCLDPQARTVARHSGSTSGIAWRSRHRQLLLLAPPGPTQSGIAGNCNKYAAAVAGDACDVFAARNGITAAQLYAWNKVLGANGENSASSLWAMEYCCVGISF